MSDPLTLAMRDVAQDLMDEGWSVDDHGEGVMPADDSFFFRTIVKHIGPLVGAEGLKEARIRQLRSELASLEERDE